MEAGPVAVLDRRLARRGIVLAAIAASAFVAIFAAIHPLDHATAFDETVATWIAAHRSPALVDAANVASLAGSVVSIVPAALAIAYLVHRRRGWHHARWFVLAIAGATAIYLALSYAIGRARPPMGLRLVEDDRWSFPSGHSTQAVVFWFTSAALVATGRPVHVRALAFGGALACALAIGGSRIVLDAHWTTDVCGGFALGTCWLGAVYAWRSTSTSSPASQIR